MTIHAGHPFADPPERRDPLRRLRGRLPAPVTVWTSGRGPDRTGLTVSSVLVADGEPGEVLGLVDEDSDLAATLTAGDRLAISVLGQPHRGLADVFAGLAPSPGGMFRTGDWTETDWGPVLLDAVGWLGVRLTSADDHAGWALLVRGVVEQVTIAEDGPAVESLLHLHGRYTRPAP